MRLMSKIASIFAIGAVLLYHRTLFTEEDDTQIIRQFLELGWKRAGSSDIQPILDWAIWCKAGLQLGEFEICPPR